jgi:DNA repair protein RecN (Recombination protein N)
MLRELRIRDVAIVEDVAVEFGSGLNVLSGETGAGKSIILGALGLVLGSRASADIVRTGRRQAEVLARVDRDAEVERVLEELGLASDPEDDGLLLRRVVTRGGRSRAWLGGTAVPISTLRTLASVLVDYSGQHEHQVLLDEATHLRILDRFGGLLPRLDGVAVLLVELRELLAERDRLARLEAERRTREDYVRFQLDELEKAELVEGELDGLEERKTLLRSAEERSTAARDAEQSLYSSSGAAVERLGQAVRQLRRLARLDPGVQPMLEGVESALIAAEEAGRDLAGYADRAQSSPRELAELEDRLSLLRRLGRKHRCSASDLAGIRDGLREELSDLSEVEELLSQLEPKIEAARATTREAAEELSRRRRAVSAELEAEVERELGSLAMARACFRVRFEELPAGSELPGLGPGGEGPFCSATGLERVGFLLSANPGEDPRQLSRVASGGELSRILLAIRRALAGSSPVQTCVFDEVDAGLGGATAEVVGRKLAGISQQVQVLCITHLPQIAAFADHHFRVVKQVFEGRTRTEAVPLTGADAADEVVRMLAGSDVEAAGAFARELIARARIAMMPIAIEAGASPEIDG